MNPTSIPPGFTSWDAWLSDPANEKSMHLTANGSTVIMNTSANELVVVTCQRADASALCPLTQIGSGEWNAANPPSPVAGAPENPMRITVAVCWRHRGRTIGQCRWVNNAWDLTTKTAWDSDVYPGGGTPGVLDSPAMASTLVTCRSS